MEREKIFTTVAEGLVDQLGISLDEIKEESTFTHDLGLDSLDEVECIMALEEEFFIEVTDEEYTSWRTVKDTVDYLEKNMDRDRVTRF